MAQAAHLEVRIADATFAMFDKYVGSLFAKARNREERRFQATRRDVARAPLLFRRTITALKQARETGEGGVAAVERVIGIKRLDEALPVIDAVTDVAGQDVLVTAAEPHAVLRRFSPRFLEAFRFQSNTLHDPVLAAVELIKAMNHNCSEPQSSGRGIAIIGGSCLESLQLVCWVGPTIAARGHINAATGIAIIRAVPTLIARDGGLGRAGKRPICCLSVDRTRNGLADPNIGHRTR